MQHPPEKHLLDFSQAQNYVRLGVMPWRMEEGVVTVATCGRSEESLAWIKEHFGPEAALALTSPLDIRRTVEREFGAQLEEESRLTLWRMSPETSARHTLFAWQRGMIFSALFLVGAAIFIAPEIALLSIVGACHAIFAATMLFKCAVYAIGTKAPATGHGWAQKLATLDEAELPVYTVLIPMYRETESLSGMLAAMAAMDYPASKLDIKLLLEEDDHQTFEAAKALRPRYQFEIIRVPPGIPRTKPRACNYALHFARGKYLTIFDADDRPERTQIKKAVYHFMHAPSDVVCLQARLAYYNAGDNLLTRFFALEYHALFSVVMRGLERIGIPLPLGGTSNHIFLAHIRELGQWDPYNVTEDADLGVRISARGYRTQMLDSYTMEEAPNQYGAWIRQRSRWIKGYMQTWLVHMRSPFALYRVIGGRAFWGFQFFVGLSSFSFLTAPVLWAVAMLWSAGLPPFSGVLLPVWLLWLTLLNLGLNLATHWYFAFYSVSRSYSVVPRMRPAAFLYPLYLLLHSVASYKALWQLVVKPHFWEKTTHGRAKTHILSPESENSH
ncbi:MAG: glycosyltransferase [Alphaproteobacteria bacterium]|nr:glycosyltransferase [Alphaproteobacteria bacterium]